MKENEKIIFNEIYQTYNEYTDDIMKAANKITKKYTFELEECIEKVILASKNKTLELTLDDLERLVIRIPALCLYLQNVFGEYALKGEIEELLIDAQVIEKLNNLRGEKGDSREKMKRAEAGCLNDRIVEAVNKQIALNIRDAVIRADKVYEGIKKIMDVRSRENEYNRKSQKWNT